VRCSRILFDMSKKLTLPALLSLVALSASAPDHPLSKDRTGLRWVLPFDAALDKAKARILFDLFDHAGARKVLEGVEGDEAAYLRGRLARFAGDWKAMKREYAPVLDPELQDDVRMELAYEPWSKGDFAALATQLKGFPKGSNRYTEARYYEGLAHFHAGKERKALKTWKSTIQSCSQDPWIYRADWAYTNAKEGEGRRAFSSAGPRTSLLNRIGYMGRRNPDLER